MNAIEFVKGCGIDVAKRILNNAIGFGCAEIELFGGKYVFRTNDLKQIVEAFELVGSWGGIDRTKIKIEYAVKNKNFYVADMMKCELNLVEQCHES